MKKNLLIIIACFVVVGLQAAMLVSQERQIARLSAALWSCMQELESKEQIWID